MGESRSLVKKLAVVMGAVDRVPKSGHNNFHNYDYATEADIVAGVREEMAKQHIMIIPNVKKCERRAAGTPEKPKTITLLEVEFTLCDGESGEEKTFTVLGEGSDNEDKGTYKAFTGAEKYALLKLFLIPTGDDPEADGKPEPRQRQQRSETRPAATPPANGTGPTTFPNFGKAKGQPIRDAAMADLEAYAASARRSLGDPSKARWHDKEKALLEAIEAEIDRQEGRQASKDRPPAVTDVEDGETEDQAKARMSGANYAEALALAEKLGWDRARTVAWLKETHSVTERKHVTQKVLANLRMKVEQANANPNRSPMPEDPGADDLDDIGDAPF